MYRLYRISQRSTPTHATEKHSSVRLLLFIVAPRFHVDQLEEAPLPIRLDSNDVLLLLRPRLEHQPALLPLVTIALELLRPSTLVPATALLRCIRTIQNGPVFRKRLLV